MFPSHDPSPSKAQIEAGTDSTDSVTPSDSGIDSGVGVVFDFDGLTIDTEYDVYVVPKVGSNYGNISKLSTSTISDLSELRGALYRFDGDNVEVTTTNIDVMNSAFGLTDRFNLVPRSGDGQATLATGINSQPCFRFDGTAKRYENGTIPFRFLTLTKYLVFKANTTTGRQELSTMQVVNGGSTSSGITISIARSAGSDRLDITVNTEVEGQTTYGYAFTDTTDLHLLEVKMESLDDDNSRLIIKLDGTNLLSVDNISPLDMQDERPFVQLGGFSDSSTNAFNGDIYEETCFMCAQTPEEEDVVYRFINARYNKNYTREDD